MHLLIKTLNIPPLLAFKPSSFILSSTHMYIDILKLSGMLRGIPYVPKLYIITRNKLQKLEDALIEQMLIAADLADRGDRDY